MKGKMTHQSTSVNSSIMMTISPTGSLQIDLSLYRQRIQQQEQQQRIQIASRFQHAECVAKQAAHCLKHWYHLNQVWLFGSLLHQPWFTLSSDIDLAIEQLSPDQYLIALAKLQDLSPEFKIDLVQIDKCSSGLKDVILSEGRLL